MACLQEVTAKHDYKADGAEELSLKKGERLHLLDDSKQWWKVQRITNNYTTDPESGFVPSNYVRKVKPSLLTSLKNTLGRKKGTQEQSTSVNNYRAKSPGQLIAPPTQKRNTTPSNEPNALRSSIGDSGDDSSQSDNTTSNNTPIGTARTKFAYTAKRSDEITLSKTDIVDILSKSEDGWWRVRLADTSGWYPSNYLEIYDANTQLAPSSPTDETGPISAGALYADTPSPDLIVAKYDYHAVKDDELNFVEGDRLTLIDRTPSEGSAWWMAACGLKRGLVPRAYFVEVQVNADGCHLDDSSSCQTDDLVSKPFVGKDWYFGRIPRSQCEILLNDHGKDGDFIVRDSETNVGGYSISLKAAERNKHFRISVDGSELIIGQQTFTSMDELVAHYKSHPIFRHESEKLFLLRPFIDPQRS